MIDDTYAVEIEKALERELKPLGNGPTKGKQPTLTEELDRVIAACQQRIKMLELIRGTL